MQTITRDQPLRQVNAMIHPAYVEKKMTILVQDRQRLRIWGPRCYGVWLQGIPMYPMYPPKIAL